MPTLSRIIVSDFRNIALEELEFSPNVNCISGGNGQGKTNLLDAIYYLSMTKSAFPTADRYNFRYGTSGFSIGGVYNMQDGMQSRFSVSVNAEGKKISRDEKAYTRLGEHIGVLPVVIVSPGDSSLVSDSGEERRRFSNGVLSQMDREYLNAIQVYNRLLSQRNRMLKEGVPDMDLVSIFDSRMEEASMPIHSARSKLATALSQLVSNYYSMISGNSEQVSVQYRSDLDKAPLSDIFRANAEKDLSLRYTTAGVQRDDFIFTMNGHPIRRCGSQGQQKSFLVALKFAQYEIMKQGYGYPPILLLDDVFDKLDLTRIANLIKMVSGSDFGQIFITDCREDRLRSIVDATTSDRAYFIAEGGAFRRTDG